MLGIFKIEGDHFVNIAYSLFRPILQAQVHMWIMFCSICLHKSILCVSTVSSCWVTIIGGWESERRSHRRSRHSFTFLVLVGMCVDSVVRRYSEKYSTSVEFRVSISQDLSERINLILSPLQQINSWDLSAMNKTTRSISLPDKTLNNNLDKVRTVLKNSDGKRTAEREKEIEVKTSNFSE